MAGPSLQTRPAPPPLRRPAPPPEDWAAAGWAGFYGGAVYLFVQMALAPVFIGASPWTSMRFIAAIVLGRAALPPPFTFNGLMFVVCVTVNFTLSMLYARLLAPAWSRMSARSALGLGLVAGLALFVVNLFLFTGLFPWFKAERDWVTLLANAAFGTTAAFVYKMLERPAADR